MNKLMLIAVLMLTGCNGLDRLVNGRESDPQSPVIEPSAPPSVTWPAITPLGSGEVLPTASVAGTVTVTASGYLPDPNVALIQTTEVTEGWVRATSTGVWRKLRFGTTFSSSVPYYTPIDGGVEIKKIYGEYDAFVLYRVQ